MVRRAVLWTLAILLTGVVGSPICAMAHPSISSAILAPPPASAVASTVVIGASGRPSYPSVGFGVAALLIAGMTVSALHATGRRGRLPIRIVGLSLLLIMTSFEGAIHSVHHLGDPAAAERCLAAAAGVHVAVVDIADPYATAPLLRASSATPPARSFLARRVWLAPDAGRGPPA